MAGVLARHGSDDMSGAHVINHHHQHDSSQNNGHTIQHHGHLPIQQTPLSWADWKKKFTDNVTSQLKVDAHPYTATSFTQIETPTVTSLPPSHPQWKAVRSSEIRPAYAEPMLSLCGAALEYCPCSLIQPLSRR